MKAYDEVLVFTEAELDRDFRERHERWMVAGSRGFGYWIWKPQVVLQALRNARDGDIVHYVDAGCHLNPGGRDRLEYYLGLAATTEKGAVGFQARFPEPPLIFDGRQLPEYLEAHWTKGDLLHRLDCAQSPWITQAPQIGGSTLFVRKSSDGEHLVDEWLALAEENRGWIDDSPSLRSNLPGFIEHRHDQSILSLLMKLGGHRTLSAFEYWYPQANSGKRDWAALATFPIHARRDLRSRTTVPTHTQAGDAEFAATPRPTNSRGKSGTQGSSC